MPSTSVDKTSRLMSPSTVFRISWTAFLYSTPALVARVGLVVTPSIIPACHIFLTSSGLALSIKSFIFVVFILYYLIKFAVLWTTRGKRILYLGLRLMFY